jgi:hypothetical protein
MGAEDIVGGVARWLTGWGRAVGNGELRDRPTGRVHTTVHPLGSNPVRWWSPLAASFPGSKQILMRCAPAATNRSIPTARYHPLDTDGQKVAAEAAAPDHVVGTAGLVDPKELGQIVRAARLPPSPLQVGGPQQPRRGVGVANPLQQQGGSCQVLGAVEALCRHHQTP